VTGARRVGDLLRVKDSALSALLRGSQRQHAFDKQFSALIDAPIAEHVHVAGAEGGILTLAADTPVWGHRIRYLAPSVLAQFRNIDPSLREVKIIVRPPRSEPPAPALPVRRARLSEASASLIGGIAASCENPKLADILRRLSKLAQRPPASKT
jgi:hypothetical protein